MARKAVAKKEDEKSLATQLPDFMAGHERHGAETLDSDIVEVPRVKLLQALSPELEENEELRAGEWYHNVNDQGLGKEFNFIPCYVFKSIILWRPRNDGGGILARSFDGKTWDQPDQEFDVELKGGTQVTWKTGKNVESSGLTKWGSENPSDPNSPPAATIMINVVAYSPDYEEGSPFVITFQRSSFKIGKKLGGNLKMSAAPIYGRVFKISSKKVEGAEGPYLEPRVLGVGLVQEAGVFARTSEIYESFKDQKITFDVGEEEDKQGTDTSSDTDAY